MKNYYEVAERTKINDDDIIYYNGYDFKEANKKYNMVLNYVDKKTSSVELRVYKVDEDLIEALLYGYDIIKERRF